MSEPAPATPPTEATPWTEAIRSGRCPLCFLLRQDEFDELRRWVGGDVADDQNRRRLDEARGFCNGHFWLLAELHSPQSGSLVNDYVATSLIEWLRHPARQDWPAQAAWLREAASRCPLCARLRACETAHLRALVGWLSDRAAWPHYAESRGLCLPHFLRCQALVQDLSLREQLCQAQAVQIERLQREMRQLARKLAAGQRWEVSRNEWVAWERATEKFVGRRGLAPP
jgi:hypothetical protein